MKATPASSAYWVTAKKFSKRTKEILKMAYPSAPWILHGFALQTVQPVDIDRARLLVPSDLDIVSVFPGKTVGGIYLSSYGTGSTFQYNELIVVSALVRYRDRLGAWISHIYVDHPDSVAGGREVWGLPKDLAEFKWQPGKPHCVSVWQGGGSHLLCRLNTSWQLPEVSLPFALGSFTKLNANLLWFSAKGNLRLSAIGATMEVPTDSPFSSLGLDQPWLSFYGNDLNLTVSAPEAIG
jgi:acetoacetate decarboxylase